MHRVTWQEVCALFSPFAGTPLGAIRADAFFNLVQAAAAPARFRAKSAAYPAIQASRMSKGEAKLPSGRYEVLMVCDYAAEAGFGTLRPLLRGGRRIALAATAPVIAQRAAELAEYRNVSVIHVDAFAYRSRESLASLWNRSRTDFDRICLQASPETKRVLMLGSSLVRTLLCRAYLYQAAAERLFEALTPDAVVLHNDFTSISNTVVHAAHRRGVAEFTLQHGLPSQEYFPVSTRNYLLWGQRFADYMRQQGVPAERLCVTGAPRLDDLASRPIGGGSGPVLFLSQTHSPVFTPGEHRSVLATLDAVAGAGFDLRIRLHPQERAAAYKDFPRLLRQIVTGGTLADTIAWASALISVNSSALLEAMLLGRPCVQLCPPPLRDRVGVLELDAIARDSGELISLLQQLQEPRHRARLLERQASCLREYVHQPGEGTKSTWQAIAHAAAARRAESAVVQ